MQPTATARPATLPPRAPARNLCARADMLNRDAIIDRMVEDLCEAPHLAARDAAIDIAFFQNLGWTRAQITAHAPRAIEEFRRAA